MWVDLAEQNGVRVVTSGPLGATVLATPGHVEQMLDNLVENAVEATPPGGTVTVQVRASPAAAEIHVLDDGPGMTAEERERAFDRFWRSPGARASTKGSGLGLAIVRQLAAVDGGAAELEPAPGGGLDAIIRLPRAG